MKFTMKGYFGIALLASVLLGSCSTDVDLNAEWRDITVVYGLLDQNDEYHYVKINKAFLGNGNALVMAEVRDSSEYDPSEINAYIEEKINGNVTRTFQLRDTAIGNREEGVFYTPEQTLYYFRATDLDETATYDLTVEIGSDPDNLKTVTASTTLINDFTITKPTSNVPGWPTQTQIPAATSNSSSNDIYPDVSLAWGSAENGKRYEMSVTFHYIEYKPGDTTYRSLDWDLGTIQTDNTDGGEPLSGEFNGSAFYQWVAARIKSSSELDDPDINMRRIRGLDFKVTVAGDDLNTYMDLNEPVTGVVQERPAFTNISNGIGLYSSRYSEVVDNKWLDPASIREMCTGQYTINMNFCTDSILWPLIVNEAQVYCP